uniref:Uncharacterized protein n=1 Tax=Rhizophora mucronata TaxID=61149 RepID=A0A2P2N0R6_RHIMU
MDWTPSEVVHFIVADKGMADAPWIKIVTAIFVAIMRTMN